MKLEAEIIAWAEQRGIFEHSGPLSQHQKTQEGVDELLADIIAGRCVKDSIGDTIVTLIIQAHMNGTTIDECVRHAYEQIKNRTGKMVDGLFVKDTR